MEEMDFLRSAHMVGFDNMGSGVFQNSTLDMHPHSHYDTTNAHNSHGLAQMVALPLVVCSVAL